MTTAGSLLPDPPPEPGAVFAATVSRAVPPMVTLDAYGSTHEWGPVTWMTPGTPPVRGARALVLIDDTGALWAYGESSSVGGGGDTITTTTLVDADLYNESGPFEGWAINDPIVFAKQGNTVHASGSAQWTGAGVGYGPSRTSIVRPSILPADFRPDVAHSRLVFGGIGDATDLLWMLFVFADGSIQLGSVHLGSPAFPLGSLAGGATPYISFGFSFAVSTVAT